MRWYTSRSWGFSGVSKKVGKRQNSWSLVSLEGCCGWNKDFCLLMTKLFMIVARFLKDQNRSFSEGREVFRSRPKFYFSQTLFELDATFYQRSRFWGFSGHFLLITNSFRAHFFTICDHFLIFFRSRRLFIISPSPW